MSDRKDAWLNTATGQRFNLDTLGPLSVVDMAISLGNQCRYAGHTRRHYSVAEHSVLVAIAARTFVHEMGTAEQREEYQGRDGSPVYWKGLTELWDELGDDLALEAFRFGLIHDAPEAYCTDVPYPLIAGGFAEGLMGLEKQTAEEVNQHFLGRQPHPAVKALVRWFDMELLDVESERVIRRHPSWPVKVKASRLTHDIWLGLSGPDRWAERWAIEMLNAGLACMGDVVAVRSFGGVA